MGGTPLTSSSLFLLKCSIYLVRLTWMVCEMGGKLLDRFCFVWTLQEHTIYEFLLTFPEVPSIPCSSY